MQRGAGLSERSSRSPLKRQRDLKRLNDVWIEHQADQDYQDIALTYLENCSDERAAAAIEEEIELTINSKSFCFSLAECKGHRSIILFKLQRELQAAEAKPYKTEAQVETLCGFIGELRDINFAYAELLINIHNHFRAYLHQEIYSRTIAEIFESLDSARVPLVSSFMGKFILFKKTYDPFFLKHEEMLRRLKHPQLKKLRCVELLFRVQMSQVYKLQRAHRFIQLYLQKPLLPERVRPKKFRVLSPIRRKNQTTSRNSKQNQDENALGDVRVFDNFNSAFRLDKDIYLSDNGKTETKEFSVSRLNIRKRSQGDQPFSQEGRNNSHSIKSMRDKKDCYLPRLNSIQSNRKHNDSTIDYKNTRETSSYSKKYNAHSTINEIDERDRELKSLFNLRKTQKDRRQTSNRSHKKSTKNTISDNEYSMREMSIQVDRMQNHLQPEEQIREQSRQSSLSREVQLRQPVVQPPPSPPPPPPQEANPKIRTYKIKSSKMSVQQCMHKLRTMSIHESYKQNLASLSTNFQQSFKSNIYYFHTQFINSELSSIALCLATPDGSIAIKYWAPIANCDPQMSSFLFKKYIEYIEKNTIKQKMYFNNHFIRELMEHQFSPTKQRLYERSRVFTTTKQLDNYHPFLNISFSSLAINKNITNQNTLILSDKLQDFNYAKFVCFNYLLIVNKYSGSQIGSDTSTLNYYPKIKSIKEAQLKLLAHKMEIQSYNADFKCDYCNLLAFMLKEVTFRSKFLANKGFLKIIGNIFYEKEESIIIKVAMQNNFSMYFGKGIQSAMEMAELYKKSCERPPGEAISMSVRMFKKRLRGRLLTINLKQQNLYGDLQIVFGWRDYLQGKIQADASDGEEVFDSTFYCLIEMAKQILFVFQITPDCFLLHL